MDATCASSETRPLLILGARAYALDVYDVLENCPGWNVVGFVENLDQTRAGTVHGGLPVYWIDELAKLTVDHWAICSLATTHRWKFTERVSEFGMSFATAVHQTAYVSRHSTLGNGCRVGIGVVIAAHSHLGKHVALNRNVTIGHHTTIGDYSTIQSAANIGGNCRIGRCTYVGMGVNILDGVTVGDHCMVGAGAVVTKNLPSRTMAYGVPATIIKEGIDGK